MTIRTQLAAARSHGAHIAADLDTLWQPCAAEIDLFKQLIARADLEALADKSGEGIGEGTQRAVFEQFRHMSQTLTEQVCLREDLSKEQRDELGARVRRELLPYLLLTQTTERFYSKPRGYAGDFMTIDNVYAQRVSGTGRVGALLDACVVMHEPASKAVRNRRQLLADEIVRGVEAHEGREPYRVTVLAAGPASEVFDAFARIPDPHRLEVTLIDIDAQAIELVNARIEAHPQLRAQIRTTHANLVYLALGRRELELELPPQDFVYSMGLIDYLQGRLVVALLDYIHGLLGPAGRVMLGNFHPRTGTRALMDYVFDWKLIFRTEADMQGLYARSAFGGCSRVVYEDARVDMFVEARVAGS